MRLSWRGQAAQPAAPQPNKAMKMAIPPSPIPQVELSQFMHALQRQTAATITAAIVTASGRAHSIQQVLDLMRDVQHAMNPQPSSGAYKEWLKTKDATLKKVHS